ncbi:hypothetical protein [Spongiactinospora sp. 9N601]|uniref:hypothetical protein n=1 Tax=Spongiactinospora sp. 9N601 TaxID=3375149 RepID=UPI003787D36E
MNIFRRIWRTIRRRSLSRTHRHLYHEAEPDNPIMLAQRLLQPPPRPCDHPAGEGLHIWDEALLIETPARGDALFFTVRVWISWCAQPKTASSLEALRAEIDLRRPAVQHTVHRLVRATARRFSAHLPEEAERALQEELAKVFLRPVHDCDDISVTCSAQGWVALGEEVLAHQREADKKLLAEHARLERTRAQVQRLGAERDLWLGFLEDCKEDWRSRYAVDLAEREGNNVAHVMATMENERREEAERFLTLLQNVVSAQQSVNVFDLVRDSESALRFALERLGVRLPEPRSEALPWERE